MNDDVNEEVFLLSLALSLLLLVFFIVTQFIGVMGISLRSFRLIFISSNFFFNVLPGISICVYMVLPVLVCAVSSNYPHPRFSINKES